MFLGEEAEPPVELAVADRADRINADRAMDLVEAVIEDLGQAQHRAENVLAAPIEFFARIGELEMAGPAVHQAASDLDLEPLERGAHRWLLQQQSMGGAGDAAFFGDREEGPQQVPVELSRE